MKLITRDTDYAIRAITCMAQEKGKIVSVTLLTEKLNIPRPFLRKILQELNKGGILKSVKGKGGGFSVRKDLENITVLEIMEIFQGPFEMSEHIFKGKLCEFLDVCSFKKKLDKLENHVLKELKKITVKSLVNMHKNK